MTVRSRHLIAYASAMLALLLWQLVSLLPAFARLSDFDQDIVYTLGSQLFCMGFVPLVVLLGLNRGNAKELFVRMRYKAPRDARACFLVTIGIMVLITPFTMAFNAVTNLIFTIVGYKRAFPVGTIYLGPGDLVVMLLITALLPAIFEEFTHRGVLLSGLQSRGSEFSAVVISAVMFAMMHVNPGQIIYAVFGGLVFGVAAVKCDSIIPAMCAHFANNAVAVVLDYSTQRQTSLGVWYDRLMSSGSVLSVAFTFFVLGISLYGMVRLLQYAARKAPKPVSERMLLGVVTLDAYSPDGKATLRENAVLYSTAAAYAAFSIVLFVWGIVK